MTRVMLYLAMAVAMMTAGCNGQTHSEDRDKIWIKHRIPSK